MTGRGEKTLARTVGRATTRSGVPGPSGLRPGLRGGFQFLHLGELAVRHLHHHVEHRLLPVFAYLYELHAGQSILSPSARPSPICCSRLPHPSDRLGLVRRDIRQPANVSIMTGSSLESVLHGVQRRPNVYHRVP